jgi:hypothetical protein
MFEDPVEAYNYLKDNIGKFFSGINFLISDAGFLALMEQNFPSQASTWAALESQRSALVGNGNVVNDAWNSVVSNVTAAGEAVNEFFGFSGLGRGLGFSMAILLGAAGALIMAAQSLYDWYAAGILYVDAREAAIRSVGATDTNPPSAFAQGVQSITNLALTAGALWFGFKLWNEYKAKK